MNTDSATLNRPGRTTLQLDFEMSQADYWEASRRAAWLSSHPYLMPSLGVLMAACSGIMLGAQVASQTREFPWFVGFFTVTQILLGWNMATNNAGAAWLDRRVTRNRVSHTRLELDDDGIRGIIEFPSPWRKGPEFKRINYTWRKVRTFYHPTGYLLLEFHGGTVVTIPEAAFDAPGEVRLCLEWVEGGLALQRPKMPARNPAAA